MQIALYLRVMDAEIINTFKAQLGDKFDEVEINRIIQEARGAAVDAFSSLSSVEGKSMDVVYKYYFEYLNNAYNNYLIQKGITL